MNHSVGDLLNQDLMQSIKIINWEYSNLDKIQSIIHYREVWIRGKFSFRIEIRNNELARFVEILKLQINDVDALYNFRPGYCSFKGGGTSFKQQVQFMHLGTRTGTDLKEFRALRESPGLHRGSWGTHCGFRSEEIFLRHIESRQHLLL